MQRRYNSFGAYIRRRFGQPVFKVNIDAGFTCPNRDGTVGTGGCTYCNNESFKPSLCRPSLTVQDQVRQGAEYLKGRYGAKMFIAYFQAYTNTHAPVDELEALYKEALAEPGVVGIAIGTRPDAVDDAKLDMIARLGEGRFALVEYGVQSVYEHTLREINRGHGYAEFLRAVAMTRERGLHAGGHLIVGFPTETRDQMLDTATEISASGIEFLKVHQLQIIRDTPMAEQYERKAFNVFGYEEYLEFLADFMDRLDPKLVMQRLFATAPDEILIAPKWGRSRHETLLDIDRVMQEKGARQGRLFKSSAYSAV